MEFFGGRAAAPTFGDVRTNRSRCFDKLCP